MDTLATPWADLPDPDSCYRALAARDARFDGLFFTGVKSTGIYCRPVCGVKTPRRASCVFFASAAAAEAAGFRPCLRCRPELAPYALQQNLAHAIWQRIAAGALNEDGDGEGGMLERLATEIGLSSRQVRRILLAQFGVTPIELAQTQRLLFAKKLLQETDLAMPEVAFSAGFRSVRRFNALFASRYRMAPGELRRAAGDCVGAGMLTMRLAYRPPYAWDAMLVYFARRGIPGVEAVLADGSYARSVRLNETQGWLRIRHLPQSCQLQLDVDLALAQALMPLMARVRAQFDLDANPAQIAAHLAQDALLVPLLQQWPGLRLPGAFDAFELAVRAVLGQQISVAGATTLAGRLAARFGRSAVTPFGEVGLHFPTPAELAAAPAEVIATLGMPGSRAKTISALARFAAEGGLRFAPGATLAQAVERLKGVPGIGEWTAQYIALRALRHPDAFPAGDLGLRRATGLADERALLARAALWSPWRGYAAMLLWHGPHPLHGDAS
ncbi:DNA-3-methyladenine glycosylase 2 [Noviherbaspirillum pedocola]|uniref:DNA-3-methyladenine glycosylase II n=1 Tax=Noviherbaspirillum pedocola TaxID=2801341 RepID=A0A934SXJ5_9BURK|nr:DNA-3-methyladenine glycosylase 2 [Noviherbaspirillum pedocola]MBK4737180.1 DNA-3-methyladenine glycosylase 2 family protein [Noviherbaspirillum pedocola]